MACGALLVLTVPTAEHEAQLATSNGLEPPASNRSMHKIVEKLLEKYCIHNCAWSECQGGKYKLVSFPLESGDKCEDILNGLSAWGVGSRYHSTVSVIPCSLHLQTEDQPANGFSAPGVKVRKDNLASWNHLMASVKARMAVDAVVKGVKADAQLTPDFLSLLLIAGLIGAFGLIENSSGILVASMLISPLMGPIMAGTFGTIIKDQELMKMGILHEVYGLLMCLFEGFLCGIVVGIVSENFSVGNWPTIEMMLRGELHSIWIGMMIALLSGAGVAISILSDNVASLVGVAISASLLPPAVNAGLLWALTCIYSFYGSTPEMRVPHTYAENPVAELAIMGAISLCLTIVNIVCIFVSAILVLKLKAVAPSSSAAHKNFWKHDVKLAQEYDKTFCGDGAKAFGRRLANELSKLSGGQQRTVTDLRSVGGLNLFHRGQDVFKVPHNTTFFNECRQSPDTHRVYGQQGSLGDVYGYSHNWEYSSPCGPKISIRVTSPNETIRPLEVIAEDTSVPSSQQSSQHSHSNIDVQMKNQRFTVIAVENTDANK